MRGVEFLIFSENFPFVIVNFRGINGKYTFHPCSLNIKSQMFISNRKKKENFPIKIS